MTAVHRTAPRSVPKPKVLFVDDEPHVLEALAMNLRRSFEVVTATSGESGLTYLRNDQDFSVVVSDMRMPRMDGAAFLTHARELVPDVVRILLTGQADLEATIKVVNQGQLFRFLTKPCPRETLQATIEAAVEQHRLINAERVLLEQTLRGSIKMLIDVLAITSPAAFGRANQIKTRVLALAEMMGLAPSWQLEIAALASQLGYIVLPRELCSKLEHGERLTDEEQAAVDRAPAMTEQLLANIPRLEAVRAILAAHVKPPRRRPDADDTSRLVELGAHLVRIAIDIETFESTPAAAGVLERLRLRSDRYDPEVLCAAEMFFAERAPQFAVKEIPLAALRVGMQLAEDVRMANGTLLVARGYEVTPSFIERVKNFPHGALRGGVRIVVPC